jgi:hypothetical protein
MQDHPYGGLKASARRSYPPCKHAILTRTKEESYPMVLQQPHGCVVRFSFAFGRTVGYQHFYLDSRTICERVVTDGFGRGTSPHIAPVVTALLVQPKGAVNLF